eukprot:TRINITY_DN17770_c0_g2_i1.p1 TRINITY_DN17770_c0_g2~~TRINITY_DN17770_c0_g2_i1.p1  ORF type:complete len:192 (+),score=19.74 TRINITY_DN17770_c0_g2_i1:52-627(+)
MASTLVVGSRAFRVCAGAFGCGAHETTRGVLRCLGRLPPRPSTARVLDLGSGTGVLAVAALRAGLAGTAVCIDTDPGAVASCMATVAANEDWLEREAVTHVHGVLHDAPLKALAQPFELYVANLYVDVLLDTAASVVPLLAPQADLVLSGVAIEDLRCYDVDAVYGRLGCEVLGSWHHEDFRTLHLKYTGV